MDSIIQVTGKVKYPITIDPGVWIFDDRKVDLETYFLTQPQQDDSLETYTKDVSMQWDKEITEGAQLQKGAGQKKFKKQLALEGSFGMPIGPFLKNASPLDDAGFLRITANGEDHLFPLGEAYNFIAGFSKNGKPLREDGPIHIYFGNGSNKENPLTNVTAFSIE